MLLVRACDLYLGYEFKICAVLKNGETKCLPPDKLKWQSCGKLQVRDGKVISVGDKYDKVVAHVIDRHQKIVASDHIILADENGSVDNWIIGVSGLDQPDDRKLVRTHDAKDKEYFIDYDNGRIATDLDGILDFQRFIDANGNHFVVIPTLYWRYKDGELCITQRSDLPDFHPYACFVSPYTGQVLNKIAIGCYKSGAVLSSKSGVYRHPSSLNQWIAKLDLYDTNQCYFLRNEYINQLLRDLFVITFASRSLTNVLKQDIGLDPINTHTGATDHIQDLLFSNPLNCCGYDAKTKSFKFFGIEDAFDGGAEWIDGLSFNRDVQTISYKYDSANAIKADGQFKLAFNDQNVQSLQTIGDENITLTVPEIGTQLYTRWWDNSLIHLSDKGTAIANSPISFSNRQRFGLLSYFSANPETDSAYTRLCCFEREETDGNTV